jgi:F-type H+-transporting ATPase subunit delta
MSTKAAKRYANAYLGLAIEKDILEKTREDMLLIKNTIDASSDFKMFLKNPIIKKDQKKAAVKQIFEGSVQDVTFEFYNLLARKDRENLLEDISNKFIELYNQHQGIIKVGVTSVKKLEEAQLKALKKSIEQTTGKKVEFNTDVDEELIGGLKIRIEDTVVDGSVKFKLSQLKDRLTSTALE